MKPHFLRLAAGVLLIVFASVPVQAQNEGSTERVQFARGTASKVIKGSIRGYAYKDYVVGARAGQVMTVDLRTSNGANYFNVLPPGSNDVAVFIGSTNGNSYRGKLEKSGDYKVRVYLMRSAARRNEVASYSLTIGVEGRSAAATSRPVGDALVPGTDFHAVAQVPCRSVAGQPMTQCKAGVMRHAGGEATVKLFTPDGGERYIYFNNGRATSSNAATPIRVERQNDLSIIRIGPVEHYEIPDALVLGG